MEAVEILELSVAVTLHHQWFGSLGGRGQRELDGLLLGVGRIGRSARSRLIHPLVAGNAPVEAGDIAEIIVNRQLGQPDLVDAEGSVKGIEHWKFEE